jgi:hypothetical protein
MVLEANLRALSMASAYHDLSAHRRIRADLIRCAPTDEACSSKQVSTFPYNR